MQEKRATLLCAKLARQTLTEFERARQAMAAARTELKPEMATKQILKRTHQVFLIGGRLEAAYFRFVAQLRTTV